eukprot:543370-Alexandrium_andersonii.AAC.1
MCIRDSRTSSTPMPSEASQLKPLGLGCNGTSANPVIEDHQFSLHDGFQFEPTLNLVVNPQKAATEQFVRASPGKSLVVDDKLIEGGIRSKMRNPFEARTPPSVRTQFRINTLMVEGPNVAARLHCSDRD